MVLEQTIMKQKYTLFYTYFILLPSLFCLQACSSEKLPQPFSGELSFNRYVAVGDEFTAGYMNGGLYAEGQEKSFPNLLVRQLNLIGNVPFKQPLLNGNGTGFWAIDSLMDQACELFPPNPHFSINQASGSWENNVARFGPYHNISFPKLKLSHVNRELLYQENPFFSRIVDIPDSGSYSYLDVLASTQSDFFSLWIGVNDVLAYALHGGDHPAYLMTEPDSFRINFLQVLYALTDQNPQTAGVVANVMDITSLPYFSTVPHEWIDAENCNGVAQAIYIETDTEVRIAGVDDLILLAADSLLGVGGWGLSAQFPIPKELVLDEAEHREVIQMIQIYNQHIKSVVNEYNSQLPKARIALVNIYEELHEATDEGLVVDGVNISGAYLSGGLFSLDGLFPTARGNAFITNIFISSMNDFFKASIPSLSITDFKGVEFP